MPKSTLIELFKENMKFSAGHFTIFSATERENCHGHNYSVYCSLLTEVDQAGLAFDYRIYKTKLLELCRKLNESFLIAGNSPHLKIEEKEKNYHIYFDGELLSFAKRDVTILPLTNITAEELSSWFIQQLLLNQAELDQHKISAITIKVFSSPGQSASATWKKS